jgi:hypothetical protein
MRRRRSGAAVFFPQLCSLFVLDKREQKANTSNAAGQGLRTTLRLPTRQFPSRRRCGRKAVVGRNFPEMCVMKPTFAVCAAVAGLLALSQSAIAEQKTARQCNDDWSANKASIQASGKTKRVFMAECRGVPLTAPASATAPAEKGQYATEAEAKASCPSDVVVWVNSISKIYHPSGSRSYGKTRTGAYMCEKDSVAAGFRAPKPRGAAT